MYYSEIFHKSSIISSCKGEHNHLQKSSRCLFGMSLCLMSLACANTLCTVRPISRDLGP